MAICGSGLHLDKLGAPPYSLSGLLVSLSIYGADQMKLRCRERRGLQQLILHQFAGFAGSTSQPA
jgi:hypothetical protein